MLSAAYTASISQESAVAAAIQLVRADEVPISGAAKAHSAGSALIDCLPPPKHYGDIADSMRNTLFDEAAMLENGGPVELSKLMRMPIFHGKRYSRRQLFEVQTEWTRLQGILFERSHSFTWWANWYNDLMEGKEVDWDFAQQVALIDDTIWEAGAEAVSAEIERLQKKFHQPPRLDETQVATQARALRSQAEATHLIAKQGSLELEAASSEYITAANCNKLPDGLEVLPKATRSLALIGDYSQREDRIAELEQEIVSLTAHIAELTAALQSSKPTLRSIYLESFAKQAGESSAKLLFSKTLWISLVAGASYVVGPIEVGDLLERFSDEVKDLMQEDPDDLLPRSHRT